MGVRVLGYELFGDVVHTRMPFRFGSTVFTASPQLFVRADVFACD